MAALNNQQLTENLRNLTTAMQGLYNQSQEVADYNTALSLLLAGLYLSSPDPHKAVAEAQALLDEQLQALKGQEALPMAVASVQQFLGNIRSILDSRGIKPLT